MPNGKFKMKYGDSISPGTFRADAPVQGFVKLEQSFQTKYRKFKYKVGKGIRKALGVEEPLIRKPSEYKKNK